MIAQRLYTFVEPHPCGGACIVTVTEAEAINYQREVGLGKNYDYPSDEEALRDFLVVHWASPVMSQGKPSMIRNILVILATIVVAHAAFFSGILVLAFAVESVCMDRYFDTYAVIAVSHFVFPVSLMTLLGLYPHIKKAAEPINRWLGKK